METLILWILVFLFAGSFLWQVAGRIRLIAAAPNTFSIDQPAARAKRFCRSWASGTASTT